MRFHIITLFPEMFDSYLKESIIARAIKNKKIKVSFYPLREFGAGKHQKVDDRSYGGGPGMVLQAEPILKAVQKIIKNRPKAKIFIFSPSGKQFDTKLADGLSKRAKDIVLICGRYEGIDARVKKILKASEVSIGPFTLTGGELPGMVMIDAITRRLRGVLGKDESIEERRVASHELYTRPEVLEWKGKKYRVPQILLSGDHKRIEEWKKDTNNRKKL